MGGRGSSVNGVPWLSEQGRGLFSMEQNMAQDGFFPLQRQVHTQAKESEGHPGNNREGLSLEFHFLHLLAINNLVLTSR